MRFENPLESVQARHDPCNSHSFSSVGFNDQHTVTRLPMTTIISAQHIKVSSFAQHTRSSHPSPLTMARSLALVALFGAAAMAAQSTTVSLLLPYTLRHAYFGSVIGADSTATTYAYGCAPGLNGVKPDDEDCGFGTSQTVTQGPSTWIYTSSYTVEEGTV